MTILGHTIGLKIIVKTMSISARTKPPMVPCAPDTKYGSGAGVIVGQLQREEEGEDAMTA